MWSFLIAALVLSVLFFLLYGSQLVQQMKKNVSKLWGRWITGDADLFSDVHVTPQYQVRQVPNDISFRDFIVDRSPSTAFINGSSPGRKSSKEPRPPWFERRRPAAENLQITSYPTSTFTYKVLPRTENVAGNSPGIPSVPVSRIQRKPSFPY
jgi:hypothetical protein